MNALFDSHCHTDETDFEAYFQASKAVGVKFFLQASAHLKAVGIHARNAAAHEGVFYSTGLHPHDAEKTEENPLEAFDAFAADARCIAVGEIGLDYFYDFTEAERQRAVFDHFLERALRWQKPAIIHCRDKTPDGPAYAETLARLRPFAEKDGRFVLHCYAGTPEYARQFLDLGGYLGFTGMVTFRQAENIRMLLRQVPRDRYLIETDAPFLAPVPHRGKPNGSFYLPLIAERIAEERGISVETVADETTDNACALFLPHLKKGVGLC